MNVCKSKKFSVYTCVSTLTDKQIVYRKEFDNLKDANDFKENVYRIASAQMVTRMIFVDNYKSIPYSFVNAKGISISIMIEGCESDSE